MIFVLSGRFLFCQEFEKQRSASEGKANIRIRRLIYQKLPNTRLKGQKLLAQGIALGCLGR